jgi:hypothetical protein
MTHRAQIDTILAQVGPWPMEERAALAFEILRDLRKKSRGAAPRNTLHRALGIAATSSPPPDDAQVRQWLADHRFQKHG